jgi:hypothetical protein
MKSCKKCGETKPLTLSIQATDALMVIEYVQTVRY